MTKKDFDALLCSKITMGVTEYYFSPGTHPFLRVDGQLKQDESYEKTSVEDTEALLDTLLMDKEKAIYQQCGDIEIPYAISGVGRFRIHFARQRSSVTVTIHMKNVSIPGLEELKIPKVLLDMINAESGLVLVAGSKKSGKSTTAAALIQYASLDRARLIATIERPVKYLLDHGKGIVNQREVGIDTSTMQNGLQDAVDDYADMIYISDLSEPSTIDKVLDVVERGYLVIACVYGDGIASVLKRLQFARGSEKVSQTKMLLANHLRGISCQQLLPGTEGKLEPVFEVLVGNQAVRKMLEENKIGQLEAIFTAHREVGTISMEQALIEAVRDERIPLQTAIRSSMNPKKLQKCLVEAGV